MAVYNIDIAHLAEFDEDSGSYYMPDDTVYALVFIFKLMRKLKIIKGNEFIYSPRANYFKLKLFI